MKNIIKNSKYKIIPIRKELLSTLRYVDNNGEKIRLIENFIANEKELFSSYEEIEKILKRKLFKLNLLIFKSKFYNLLNKEKLKIQLENIISSCNNILLKIELYEEILFTIHFDSNIYYDLEENSRILYSKTNQFLKKLKILKKIYKFIYLKKEIIEEKNENNNINLEKNYNNNNNMNNFSKKNNLNFTKLVEHKNLLIHKMINTKNNEKELKNINEEYYILLVKEYFYSYYSALLKDKESILNLKYENELRNLNNIYDASIRNYKKINEIIKVKKEQYNKFQKVYRDIKSKQEDKVYFNEEYLEEFVGNFFKNISNNIYKMYIKGRENSIIDIYGGFGKLKKNFNYNNRI